MERRNGGWDSLATTSSILSYHALQNHNKPLSTFAHHPAPSVSEITRLDTCSSSVSRWLRWSMLSTVRSVFPAANFRFCRLRRVKRSPISLLQPTFLCFPPAHHTNQPHPSQSRGIIRGLRAFAKDSTEKPRILALSAGPLVRHALSLSSACSLSPLVQSSTWVPEPVRYWPFSVVRHCGTKFFFALTLLLPPPQPQPTQPVRTPTLP